jgi:hypothetical protein
MARIEENSNTEERLYVLRAETSSLLQYLSLMAPILPLELREKVLCVLNRNHD